MTMKSTEYRVRVKVKTIEGKCPLLAPGDEFVVEKQAFPLAKIRTASGALCFHAVCGLYGAIMMARSGPPGRVSCVQCLDPGPPYNEHGGRVIFEVSTEAEVES